jgi:hypothetical protein
VESSFITHPTEDKARFDPKAAAGGSGHGTGRIVAAEMNPPFGRRGRSHLPALRWGTERRQCY